MTGTKTEILKRLQNELPDDKLIMATYWTEDDIIKEAEYCFNVSLRFIREHIETILNKLHKQISTNDEVINVIDDVWNGSN